MHKIYYISKGILSLAFFALTTLIFAQFQPRWYDIESRNMFYPSDEYYIGYSEDIRNSYIPLETQLKQVSDASRVELMGSVQIAVKNTTTDWMQSVQSQSTSQDWSEQLNQIFSSKTQTSVDLQLPGVKVETWQNSIENTVVAFAYVRKADLINHFDKQITVSIVRLENALQNIAQMEAIGQKTDARKLAETSIKHITDIEYAQRILLAVDGSRDESKLQIQESNELKQQLLYKLSELQHSLTIYIQCNADMFGNQYVALLGDIKGELSKLGCSFVNAPDVADYIVEVNASAREYNIYQLGNISTYHAYVDVNYSITKAVTMQRIYEDEISVKGSHTHNYVQAARTAYKDISKELAPILKEQIK